MSTLRIKEAIIRFNQNRKPGEEKINQRKLCLLVIKGDNDKLKEWMLSRWANGENMTSLRIEHIKAICDALRVDANYLLDVKPIKT